MVDGEAQSLVHCMSHLSNNMRFFAAIQVPSMWVNILEEGQRELRKRYGDAVRWVSPELFHITIRFIGQVPESEINRLVAAWSREEIRVPSISMRLSTWGCFPEYGPERVLWAGVEVEGDAWKYLCSQVDILLERFDIRCNKGNSVPHITVGRVKNPHSIEGIRRKLDDMRIGTELHTVESIYLFESRPSPCGSSYQRHASFKLS